MEQKELNCFKVISYQEFPDFVKDKAKLNFPFIPQNDMEAVFAEFKRIPTSDIDDFLDALDKWKDEAYKCENSNNHQEAENIIKGLHKMIQYMEDNGNEEIKGYAKIYLNDLTI